MATAKVYIHGGDYDCSDLVRMCYRAAGVLPYGSYMWTGNEVQLLKEHGFREESLNTPLIGDVLWRAGHTEIYLGNGMQGGARISEHGTINGTKGDQTGSEITRSSYRASSWTKLLRYVGDITVDGIPAAIVAAKTADHIIDHQAHGYSQPNRSGDGTIEEIKITWSPAIKWLPLTKPFAFTFSQETKVRTSPEIRTDNLMNARWRKGDTATFDGIAFGSGYMWGTYIGPSTKKRLFSAIGTHELGRII